MKVEFHIKDIAITAKQKSLIEKKLLRLKRYIKDEPLLIDCYLRDETSPEKGGTDQAVELSTIVSKEKIFIREVDDRLMRAFVFAYKHFERQLQRLHKQRIDRSHQGSENYISKALKALRIKR